MRNAQRIKRALKPSAVDTVLHSELPELPEVTPELRSVKTFANEEEDLHARTPSTTMQGLSDADSDCEAPLTSGFEQSIQNNKNASNKRDMDIWEELHTHQGLVELPGGLVDPETELFEGNELLLRPQDDEVACGSKRRGPDASTPVDAPSDDESSESSDKKRRRPIIRPSYKCGKCGQFKKGHVCPVKDPLVPRVFQLGWDGMKSDMYIPFSELLNNPTLKNTIVIGGKPGVKPESTAMGHIALVPAFILAGSADANQFDQLDSDKILEAVAAAAANAVKPSELKKAKTEKSGVAH